MDIYFALQSDSDGTPLTGEAANVTVYLSINGGSFTASTNAAAEIGRGAYKVTLTSAEAAFQTLLYAPVCTGAQSNIYQLDAAPAIPTASDNATAVWGAQTKEVTIATAQAETFATASALTTVGNNVTAIKAKTDNLPQNPAAVGSEMALTNTAISAVQNGLATSSELSALETHGDSYWHTASTAGLATGQGLESLATYGDAHWATADLSDVSTFNASTDTVTINSEQAASMITADVSSLATSAEITAASASLTTLINLLLSGLYHWQVNDTIMTVYNASDVAIGAYTLTKDATGNITAVTPIVQQQDTNNEG